MALIYVDRPSRKTGQGEMSNYEQANAARMRIDRRIQAIIRLNSELDVWGFGLSVGIAFPEEGSTIDSLKLAAEKEMYVVKEARKKQRPAYRPAPEAKSITA